MEWQTRTLGEAAGGEEAGVRHWYNYISTRGRRLCSKSSTKRASCLVNRMAKDNGLGEGEVDELKDASFARFGRNQAGSGDV